MGVLRVKSRVPRLRVVSRLWGFEGKEQVAKVVGCEQNLVFVGTEHKCESFRVESRMVSWLRVVSGRGCLPAKKGMGLRLQVEAVWCICLYRARVELITGCVVGR